MRVLIPLKKTTVVKVTKRILSLGNRELRRSKSTLIKGKIESISLTTLFYTSTNKEVSCVLNNYNVF